ncbi:hypothetical protein, partial [Enterococcus faecium]|uniref:hypothetical protein n=1 Tax=Enterococcus faecium TaxID=1352 RepID=UPI0034E96807
MGSVDRVKHSTSVANSIYDIRDNWAQYAQTQLALNTPVNIHLSRTFDNGTSTLALTVELHYTFAQTDTQALSVYLT